MSCWIEDLKGKFSEDTSFGTRRNSPHYLKFYVEEFSALNNQQLNSLQELLLDLQGGENLVSKAILRCRTDCQAMKKPEFNSTKPTRPKETGYESYTSRGQTARFHSEAK